jgi:hypothetical protein
MVRSYGQETHEIPVAIRSATAGLRDSQGVDGINALRWLHAHDFFPLQTVVTVYVTSVVTLGQTPPNFPSIFEIIW